MSSADLLKRDATDQLDALRQRAVTARQLLEASFARAESLQSKVNAVVARDVDGARSAADRIDAQMADQAALGPLAGLPMTVKDTLDVEGLPASAGLARWQGRDVKDAEVVAYARRAGAVIWGKTNTPVNAADWQTYNRLYGTTSNPWNLQRTVGGSSGGSAAAVAAGISAIDIGADIGGSLRIPASFCGIYAHKPSFGLVSQRGLVPPADAAADLDLAVVGPMARSVRDLRLMLSVMTGQPAEPRTPPPRLEGLKIGLWMDEPSFPLDPEVKAVVERLAKTLSAGGAVIEPIGCPVGADRLMFTYLMLLLPLTNGDGPLAERLLYEALRGPARIACAMGARPLSWAHSILGATARHRDWLKANEERAQMGLEMKTLFERYDVIISPITPTVAFRHDHDPFLARRLTFSDGRRIRYLEMMNWIALATALGLPATTIPAGLSASGLPVGVQVIGPRGEDDRTLSAAEAISAATDGFQPPPI